MSSDRSRRRHELGDGYKEVVAQQGRVIIDRDINAVQRLTAERIASDALDFVGPCGTPDNGFAISVAGASPPFHTPLWSPPAFPDPQTGQYFDFLISPGTMYIGGERAFLPEAQSGHRITYSYFDQPDWLAPTDPDLMENMRQQQSARELVYLELTEQEVSAVEDPELLDVALGGPDTTQRVKLLQRVKRQMVSAQADCTEAWNEVTKLWRQRDGRRFDPKTMRLEPLTHLRVGFTETLTERNPCDPVASGGYFGVDNQLIRVQLRQGTKPSLLWSYDNASFLYRVTSVSDDRTMLTLAKDPPDSFHIPQTGQLVEVLKTAAVLGVEPDETDPTGQTVAYRVVAETQGELRRLTQPFGPVTTGDDTHFIVLDNPLPQDYALGDGPPIFLRVWRAELPVAADGGVVALDDPAAGTSTGVEVNVSTFKGIPLSGGAFWELALRPATPQGVYPEHLLVSPQPAEGPRQWVCPLAVINWRGEGGPQVIDCRQHFESLVALTKRRPGCCTVSVSPSDLAHRSLQSFADRAAAAGKGSKLCLSPGIYNLQEPLRLTSDHAYLTIEACGPNVFLQGADNAQPDAFSDGLVVLTETASITLRGLGLYPVLAPFPGKALGGLASGPITEQELKGVLDRLRVSIGVRAVNAQDLTLEDCMIELTAGGAADLEIVGAGLFLQGTCSDLKIRRCNFGSTIGLTFHPAQQDAPGDVIHIPLREMLVRAGDGSPPATLHTLGDVTERMRLSVAGMADRIGVATTAAAQTRLVLTAGIVVAAFTGRLPGNLADSQIEACHFENLTFAGFSTAQFGLLRVQNNSVEACISGFWFTLPGHQEPRERIALALYRRITQHMEFEELVLTVLFESYPAPAGVQPGDTLPLRPRPSSLFLLANQIAVLPSQIRESSLALSILANRPPSDFDITFSLVMSSNHLRNRSTSAPTALIVVPSDERTSITGNLVMNELQGETAVSLALIPDAMTPIHQLAVTGNVLRGPSTLQAMNRPGANQTWHAYNADPD